MIGRRDIDPPGDNRFAVHAMRGGQGTIATQQPGQVTAMRTDVKHDQNGGIQVRRHGRDNGAQCVDAAGGCANGDDGEPLRYD